MIRSAVPGPMNDGGILERKAAGDRGVEVESSDGHPNRRHDIAGRDVRRKRLGTGRSYSHVAGRNMPRTAEPTAARTTLSTLTTAQVAGARPECTKEARSHDHQHERNCEDQKPVAERIFPGQRCREADSERRYQQAQRSRGRPNQMHAPQQKIRAATSSSAKPAGLSKAPRSCRGSHDTDLR